MRRACLSLLLACLAAAVWSEPTVDGRVSPGEYAHSVPALDGDAAIRYASDGRGGLYVAVSAAADGWLGIGLGSQVMAGASILMGYVKDGRGVFSEQLGAGHGHGENPSPLADSSAVSRDGGVLTIEFHVPAGRLPAAGGRVEFIVAYSTGADLTSYHESNHDSGSFQLP